MPGRQQLEAAVGPEGVALAGEHARRVLVLALEGEGAGGVGEASPARCRAAATSGSRRGPRSAAARPCGSCCRTAWCGRARCGSPGRGSSPRTRRRRRRAASPARRRAGAGRGVEPGLALARPAPSDGADRVALDRLRLGQHARALAQLLHLARQPRLRPAPAACSRAPRRRSRPGSGPRAPGTIGTWCVLCRVATGGSVPSSTGRPSAARRGSIAW